MNAHADAERRENDRSDGERKKARQVTTESSERRVICTIHEQRRQEEDERELGVERNRGKSGDKCERATADEQRGGGRPAQLQREPVEPDDECEQGEDKFEGFDGMQC